VKKERGYYRMHRGWMEHPVFANEAFTEREAFEWLVGEATWQEDRVVAHKGNPVKVDRGQVPHSIRFMADAWGWNPSKTLRFVDKLKKWNMIETATETGQLIITICNYDKYQKGETQTETAVEEKPERDRNSSGTNIKKDNTSKEGKRGAAPYSEKFEEAWKAYPTTPVMSKAEGWRSWQKARRPEAELIQAVKAYADLLSKPDAPFAAHFATFFNQHRYEGFLAETDKAQADKAEQSALIESLSGIEKALCQELTPPIYSAWLSKAKIRDGPEITIEFPSEFQRQFFQDKHRDKAERAVWKKIRCTIQQTQGFQTR
jgi:hypothetical protein